MSNIETKVYKLHCDPSHAWLAVPLSDITALGIQNEISTFSYINEDIVYLEEDVDMVSFQSAKQQENPKWVLDAVNIETSSVRDFKRYCVE